MAKDGWTSVAAMFGPFPDDRIEDLEFKLGMLNAFGLEGVDTPENRDRVVGLLREKLNQLQPPMTYAEGVAAEPLKKGQAVIRCDDGKWRSAETYRDYGEQ